MSKNLKIEQKIWRWCKLWKFRAQTANTIRPKTRQT